MLFSIIVPIHNMEDYLQVCIESILNQTYTNFQVILVDDGSTDNSADICRNLEIIDERIKLIVKENGGVSSARNAGIEIAEGEYITFIDADDLISPDLLSQIEKIVKLDADIIQYNMKRFEGHNIQGLMHSKNTVNYKIQMKNSYESLVSFYTDGRITSTVCNKFFKNYLLSDIRFDNKARYFAEDVLFVIETLLKADNILELEYQGYYYRISPNSAVTMGLNLNKMESSMYVYVRNKELLRKFDKTIYDLADKFLCTSLINWRVRKGDVFQKDRKQVDKMIRKLLRKNIIDFIQNPIIRVKYKILMLFSMGSLRFIDFYKSVSILYSRE